MVWGEREKKCVSHLKPKPRPAVQSQEKSPGRMTQGFSVLVHLKRLTQTSLLLQQLLPLEPLQQGLLLRRQRLQLQQLSQLLFRP